jgi:hypothetical protein
VELSRPGTLSALSGPGDAAHSLAEQRHSVQHRVHLRHDIPGFGQGLLARRRAQGDVQRGALLGDVVVSWGTLLTSVVLYPWAHAVARVPAKDMVLWPIPSRHSELRHFRID